MGLVKRASILVRLIVAAVVALLFGALPFAAQLSSAYDVEVRSLPWRTQAGRVTTANPIGQGFQCTWNGLRHIDVALVSLGPIEDSGLDLVLRESSAAGPEVRRASLDVEAFTPGNDWGRFEFEPLTDSAGKNYWFELVATGAKRRSAFSPWVRFHGHPGNDTPWGDRIAAGPVHQGSLADFSAVGLADPNHGHAMAPNLCAVAFATESFEAALGPATFELWAEGEDIDPSAPLRRVESTGGDEVHGGYLFFPFEPVAESRHQRFLYRLRANDSARFVAFEEGLSVKLFHGRPLGAAPLLGMTHGKELQLDRSLIFRARSEPSSIQVFQRIHERAGWKLAIGALSWWLAMALALRWAFTK